MNEKQILEMFFGDVLPSIAKGELRIDDIPYNIRFNTDVYQNGKKFSIGNDYNPDIPTMAIKNVEEFSKLLIEYINELRNTKTTWATPYMSVSSPENEVKYFLSLMWSNMTANDFLDPSYYIQRYLSFIRDTTFIDFERVSDPIEKLDNCCLKIVNTHQKSCYETPYSFRLTIINSEGSEYILPDVKYAIEDFFGEKRAYIYAVQYDPKLKELNYQNKNLVLR